ncbi:MAG: YbjN domain-containing protein [Bacteroidetes bacterium]|nr:YbjN domain-containing protein [Bacteroidota bacterium]
MDLNLSFHTTLNPPTKPSTHDKAWDQVLDCHKQKDFKGIIRGIINYVDPDLAVRCGNAERTVFEIPHGSISLNISMIGDHLDVEAPFLSISESKRIPLMRKVNEMNFSPLNLSSIQLEGDRLFFRYSCPIELCEPYKTYDTLREICVYADSYDDEFIQKFDASWIKEPSIKPYSSNKIDAAKTHLSLYINEAKDGISYFETKRAFNLAWDLIVITLMKIEYYIQAQGLLRTEIEKMISYQTGSRDPINEKVSRGKAFLKKLEDYPAEELEKYLYATETFIPYKVRSNQQSIRSNSETAFAQTKKEIEQGNHLGATFSLLYHFYNLFYHNDVPGDIRERVEGALKAASAKPFHESSTILFTALTWVMSKDDKERPEQKRVFFSKLFGNKKA